jgi:hypothetical protein
MQECMVRTRSVQQTVGSQIAGGVVVTLHLRTPEMAHYTDFTEEIHYKSALRSTDSTSPCDLENQRTYPQHLPATPDFTGLHHRV